MSEWVLLALEDKSTLVPYTMRVRLDEPLLLYQAGEQGIEMSCIEPVIKAWFTGVY